MTSLWTSRDAAAATGGQAIAPWEATGMSIDTRSIQPGDLFIALSDRRDGHDFVADALAKGAAGALVSHVPDGVAADAPLLVVRDVLDALRAMAAARRAETKARIVAVTGSVGKTSTKEMLRAALARFGSVHAAEKSFNNHWGVPLTLARCPVDVDFGVIEIGMNHPGEIAPLAALTRPDVAVVTTIAPAHLEAFGRIEGIAEEKASIFAGLVEDGAAVWNADLPTSPILQDAADRFSRSLSFGKTDHTDARLVSATNDSNGLRYSVAIGGHIVEGRLTAPGLHLAMNSAAVLCVAMALGLDPHLAAEGLGDWTPPEGRGTRENVCLPDGGRLTLIDESYNANPTSIEAALETLAATEVDGGRRVAVLGDMLELGPDEAQLHSGLARLDSMRRIDLVHCCGSRMRSLWDALPDRQRGVWTEDAADMAARVAEVARAGDVVMVKGSFGSRVGQVVGAFRGLAVSKETEGQG